ncbi:hypothetical protein, partial [Vibrio cyclitrophicus]|uniref:hypothetical protein n=2 Tax=Vibrio cyclitrophicus TaxID=47951 RepID=UPI001A7E1772
VNLNVFASVVSYLIGRYTTGVIMEQGNAAFDDVIMYMRENSLSYLHQFNFSACELWLCNEICKILNFDVENSVSSLRKEFVYNEDNKRDISIYNETSELKLLEHIEVKVVYPTNKLTHKINWLDSLKNKLEGSSNVSSCGLNGWVFYVWTSCDKYKKLYPDPLTFFQRDAYDISQKLGSEYVSVSEFQCLDIIDDNFLWRGEEKRIVVKGMAFNKVV